MDISPQGLQLLMGREGKRNGKSLLDRYWPKVEVRSYAECWPWKAKARHPFGYGRMSAGRKVQIKAHQLAYFIQYGPIPAGMCVLHKCDNPGCCNPFHLFLGTQKDNTQDMIRKGRWSKPPIAYGEKHHAATIPDADIPLIVADKRTNCVIAKQYGVSDNTISRIKRGLNRGYQPPGTRASHG